MSTPGNVWGKVSRNEYVEHTMHVNVQDPALFVYDEAESLEENMGVTMAQNFSIRAGLRKFGRNGEKVVSNELTQLHTIGTYYPVNPTTLTKQQKLDALNSLMFLIGKRNGEIKARACADGIKQRKQENYRKEDNDSPTCSNEGIMITSTIEH